MYSGIGGLLYWKGAAGRGWWRGGRMFVHRPRPAPGSCPGLRSGKGCGRGWLGGWVRSGGGAECADGWQQAGEHDGEGGDHERFGAGGEAGSLAEGAGGDGRGGPAGRAGLEGGDAEQGDADVAEQGERLGGGDGAGVHAFQQRGGLGVAESGGDGGGGGVDAVLEQDGQRAEDGERGAGGG